MTSTQKTVIITAAVIAGLILIGIVALQSLLAGTPIIIKGYSPAGNYLVLEQGFPDPEQKEDHSVFEAPTSIKLTSDTNLCLAYNFGIFDVFRIDLRTDSSAPELVLNDEDWFFIVGMKFKEGRFSHDGRRYTSLAPRNISSLAITANGAKCTTTGGAAVDPCPTSFPNTWVSFNNLTIELAYEASCP